MTLTPEQAQKLRAVLVRCVGDQVVCRNCGRTQGLDTTQAGKDAWELLKELFGGATVDGNPGQSVPNPIP